MRGEEDELLRRALGYAERYRQSVTARPVAARLDGAAIQQSLADLRTLPAEGVSAEQTLEELVSLAEPGLTSMVGPRFFGWVIGGTLPAALAADWLTSTWDQNAGTGGFGAPAAAAFETHALDWIVQLLGLPKETVGALVTGAMQANFVALASARDQLLYALDWDVQQQGLFEAPEIRVFVGSERHATIDKSLRLLGIGKRLVSCIDSDNQGRMRPQALARELADCDCPAIVCTQLGNVHSGACDPLTEIAEVVDGFRAKRDPGWAWIHVDGAFGLWLRAVPQLAKLAAGAELADSWATDAHKFLNVPYDCGVALCRNARAQRRAMSISGAYLDSGSNVEVPNPGMFSPELSRRARGFALWAALRNLGQSGVAELGSRLHALAKAFATELALHPHFQIANEVCFNQIVLLSAAPRGIDKRTWIGNLNRAIQQEGTCYPTPSVWRGEPVLRFSVCNATTTPSDIRLSAAAVIRVEQRLRAELEA